MPLAFSSPSNVRAASGRSGILFLAIVLVVLLSGLVLSLRMNSHRPVEVAQVDAPPVSPLLRNGVWYWLLRPNGPKARLVGGSKTIAEADEISAYGIDDRKIVWAERTGSRWTIYSASMQTGDATDKRSLWSGEVRPQSVCLAANRVYWSQPQPPAAPDSGPFPPLSAQVRIYSTPASDLTSSVSPTLLTTLMAREAEILGAHGEDLYIRALCAGAPGAMSFYRVPVAGGEATRLTGESGPYPALLAADGTLYWLGPSRESSASIGTCCVRRMGKDGHSETLMDWLPASGSLYDTDRGICYVGGPVQPDLWFTPPPGALPQPCPHPSGYAFMAAGESQALLRPESIFGHTAPLFRMPLP